MKKMFLLSALMAAFGMSQAQEVQTYSVYDTDQNGTINVGDAVGVANQAVQNVAADKTQQYVTAEDLRALLKSIHDDLSLIKEKLGIETPDANGVVSKGHDYVDLGLSDTNGKPIYWATCNVGAESAEDYGEYFAWGETTGYTSDTSDGHLFNWANCPFNGGNSSYSLSAWEAAKSDAVDADGNLLPVNDAVRTNWGGAWRMPTVTELEQLYEHCYWVWVTSYNGKTVNGFVVYKAKSDADQGKRPVYDASKDSYVIPTPEASYSVASDAHIFFPAAGWRTGSDLGYPTQRGVYWTSSIDEDKYYGRNLSFGQNYLSCNTFNRKDGLPIRPVCQ